MCSSFMTAIEVSEFLWVVLAPAGMPGLQRTFLSKETVNRTTLVEIWHVLVGAGWGLGVGGGHAQGDTHASVMPPG